MAGRQRAAERAAELRVELAPIYYRTPPKPKTRKTASGIVVVAGDFHFPLSDPRVEDVLLQVVKDIEPESVVLNGDLPDMLAVSKYPKDLVHRWPLIEERRAMHDFLYRLHEATDAPIYETNANHSGAGLESRWRRYLSQQVGGELGTLTPAVEALEYANIWHPQQPWSRIQLVDYHTIAPGLIAIHGDVVRKNAAYSAKAMLEKYRVNLIMGHTHRMGYTGYRVPAIGGQKEHQMRAYEGGCMCRLEQSYGSTFDWQQGFSVVHYTPEGQFTVEQVLVHQGVAVVPSLGGTYRAAG